MCECPPLEEGQEGGGNELRVHGLHLLSAAPDEHAHLLTLVYIWFPVRRWCMSTSSPIQQPIKHMSVSLTYASCRQPPGRRESPG